LLQSYTPTRNVCSFPTRRSSDLTETGIIMLVYLREAIDKRGGLENIKSEEELRQAIIEGAVHRLRPKLLTEGVAILAIAPMLYIDRKSTRLNSSHEWSSYAVFCL